MHPSVTMFTVIAMLAALHAPVVLVLSTDPLTLHVPNSKPAGQDIRSSRSSNSTIVEFSLRIVFPQAIPEGRKGISEFCFTPDDTPGKCQPIKDCKVYHNRPYAVKIRYCETTTNSSSNRLICCPEMSHRQGEVVNEQGGHLYQASVAETHTKPTTANILSDAIETAEKPQNVPMTTTPSPLTASGQGTEDSSYAIATTTPIMVDISVAKPVKPEEKSDSENSTSLTSSIDLNQFDFSSDDAQNVCGAFDAKQQDYWPWIVSIGREHSDNKTIEWLCLGSLITSEYILTTAYCLQGAPDVVAMGAFTGTVTVGAVEEKNVVIRRIAESSQFRKYIFPNMYKNIGMVKLNALVKVTSESSPVCFPFVAGVLDIIEFNGWDAYSMAKVTTGASLDTLKIGRYKIPKNAQCAKVTSLTLSTSRERLPNGLKMDLLCGIAQRNSSMLPIEGSPVVVFDPASSSYVIIGIAADNTKNSPQFPARIALFTRINSFSSWVRDMTGSLPTPPPCYEEETETNFSN